MDSTGILAARPAILTVEVTQMAIVAMVLVSIVFIGPLVWRIWQDRRQDEGDVIAADIRAAINRRLRGESLVAVRVTPRAPWRSGRIVLSVPSGYESLVETAWPGVARRLPPPRSTAALGRHAARRLAPCRARRDRRGTAPRRHDRSLTGPAGPTKLADDRLTTADALRSARAGDGRVGARGRVRRSAAHHPRKQRSRPCGKTR